MKTLRFLYASWIFVLLLALVFVQPVLADGDEPRLEISAESLNPGSVLDIRGVDFEFEEEVVLVLIGPQVEFPLGTVIADVEGVFLVTAALPLELTEGTYVIRATTDDHVLDSPQITVWGTADLGGGEDGLRGEEDGLLAPMPTYDPNFSSTPIMESAASEESVPAHNSMTPLWWIAAGIGIVLLLGLLIGAKK